MWLVAGGARVPVSALNLSIGGVAVDARTDADVGTVVALEAEFGRRLGFALEAEVVRAERGVLGLRFLALGQRELEALLEASGYGASSEGAEEASVRLEEISGPESGV